MKDQHAIGWLDVDVLGRLRPESLFAWLLEAASSHAEGMPYGYHELAAQRVKWVTVKMQLQILRQPRWGDRVTVETRGKRIEPLSAMRDFAMTTSAGEKLVSAISAWQTTRDELIVGGRSRRPATIANSSKRTRRYPYKPTIL
jgi:medium-chain acyl-[acyl-carrier-protein] hydrolase